METPYNTPKTNEMLPEVPPPSPEGELMETTRGGQNLDLTSHIPPPSPEGELMETFYTSYIPITIKNPTAFT